MEIRVCICIWLLWKFEFANCEFESRQANLRVAKLTAKREMNEISLFLLSLRLANLNESKTNSKLVNKAQNFCEARSLEIRSQSLTSILVEFQTRICEFAKSKISNFELRTLKFGSSKIGIFDSELQIANFGRILLPFNFASFVRVIIQFSCFGCKITNFGPSKFEWQILASKFDQTQNSEFEVRILRFEVRKAKFAICKFCVQLKQTNKQIEFKLEIRILYSNFEIRRLNSSFKATNKRKFANSSTFASQATKIHDSLQFNFVSFRFISLCFVLFLSNFNLRAKKAADEFRIAKFEFRISKFEFRIQNSKLKVRISSELQFSSLQIRSLKCDFQLNSIQFDSIKLN